MYLFLFCHQIDVVDSFVYLGSCVDSSGGNNEDIQRRIELACTRYLYESPCLWNLNMELLQICIN